MEDQGQPFLSSAKPANTNYATLYTAGNGYAVVSSIIIAANDVATATVAWNDGTTDWVIVDAIPMAAGHTTVIDLKGFLLPKTALLKAKSSVASKITFTACGVFIQRK